MSLSSTNFGKDNKVYGLLYPMGNPEQVIWEITLYSSERGRKIGMNYLQRLIGQYRPILRFELTISEIRERGLLVPFIPGDRAGKVDKNVVKAKWKHKGTKRPSWKDN